MLLSWVTSDVFHDISVDTIQIWHFAIQNKFNASETYFSVKSALPSIFQIYFVGKKDSVT